MKPETPSSFGEMLRAFRKRSHLTQQQLASTLGVHYNTISGWERGNTLPETKRMIVELGKQLHLDDLESRQLLEASLSIPAPYWNVPLRRNPFFTGRQQLLETLYRRLEADQAATFIQAYAIHGLGGIGKTQLAVEYAYLHALEYTAIFWIAAESVEQMLTSFQAIAELLQLPERQESDQQLMVTAVQGWLCQHSRWLLIWDNLEEVELLQRYLPPARQGAMLITTRCQALGIVAQDMELPVMSGDEGMRLFLLRAKMLTTEDADEYIGYLATSRSDEYLAAQKVVTTLGGLPLALDQAGAYIEATQCSLHDYVSLLQSSQLRLLNEYDGPGDHPLSVAQTLALVFEQLEQHAPLALEVVTACAFLAPEAIPEVFFLQGASQLGASFETLAADPFAFQAALKALLRYSLIRRDASAHTLFIHRLVQVVLKGQLSDEGWHVWAERVTGAMTHLFPSDEHLQTDYWPVCEQLLSHALACLNLHRPWSESTALPLPLMSHVATYLYKRARYQEAEQLFTQTVQRGECLLDAHHPLLAETLNGLGNLYVDQGKYELAEPLYQRALRIWEQTSGPDHPQIAAPLKSLGSLYHLQGKYELAEPLYQRALRIWEQALGPDHPQVAVPLNSLGNLYVDQSKYQLAEPLYQRTLHIREQMLGPEHPQVAYPLNNLGILYYLQGKYELAEPLYQRALHIWEQALGPDHSLVASPLNNLSELYVDQGKYELAEPLYRRALHIWEQKLSPDHPQVALSLNNLGLLNYLQGKYELAEPLYQQALHIGEQALGPDHPQVASPLNHLGNLYVEQHKYELAEPLYRRALCIREQAFGPDHPDVASPLNGLANLYRERGQYEQAEPLYLRALALRQRHLGTHHPDVAETLHDLACFYQQQFQITRAISLYQQALAIREQVLGARHPKLLKTKNALCQLSEHVAGTTASTRRRGQATEARKTSLCACGCGCEVDTRKSRGEVRRFYSNACKQRFYRNTSRAKRNASSR